MSSRLQPLKHIPLRGIGRIQVRYSPDIVHFYMDEKLLSEYPLHPSRPQMDSWLSDVPLGSLRWHITTRPSVGILKKAVQRNALQSKWYKVFCEALWDAGYIKDGRVAETRQRGLSGTLDISVFDGYGFDKPENELARDCGRIIDTIRKHQTEGLLWRPQSEKSTKGKSGVHPFQHDRRRSHVPQ